MPRKVLAFIICFCLIFEQAGFAQVAPQLGVPAYLQNIAPVADKFRPIHLRSLSFDQATSNFNLLLDKGDVKSLQKPQIEETTRKLLEYFKIGLTLPNSMFWVNLRPDAPRDIIDPYVEQTDLGKILLEADLQLKKDMARLTAPTTPEGKQYWDKLYQKAESLYGMQDMEIPTITRPWIVPGEIVIGEAKDQAYIYKATLKVMLEQDYLKDTMFYSFDDERAKQLNDYSSQILRELIIPKLTREVNASKRYAALRQVYYSIILAQWFKQRYRNANNSYVSRIDTKDLTGLTSATKWSKDKYYQAYKKSFSQGEYNQQETIYTPYGQTIRSYFSGGLALASSASGQSVTKTIFRDLRFSPEGTVVSAAIDGTVTTTEATVKVVDPVSVEQYRRLSKTEREILLAKFFEAFKPIQRADDGILNTYSRYPLADSLKMAELLKAAQKIVTTVPREYRKVSLGRTPLWFLDTARILEGNGAEYIYAAFSGRWYEKKNDFFRPGPVGPNKQQVASYREYLQQIGLTPKIIITQANEGKKTVLFEYTQTGESIASFLSILLEWAIETNSDDELRESLEICILQDPILPKIKYLNGFTITHLTVDHELVRDLANSDAFDDSLGEHYPYWEWDKRSIVDVYPMLNGSERAALVRFRIIDFLSQRGLLPTVENSLSNAVGTRPDIIHKDGESHSEKDGGRIEEITQDVKKLLEAREVDPAGIDVQELRKLAERIDAAQQASQGTGQVLVNLSGISMPGIAADSVLLGFMGTESADAVILDDRADTATLGMIPGLRNLFNTLRWIPQYRGRIKELIQEVLERQSELSSHELTVYVDTALDQEESLSAWLLDLDLLSLLTSVGGTHNKDRMFKSVLAFALTPGASAILSADETVKLIEKHGTDSIQILSMLKTLIESGVLTAQEEVATLLDMIAQSRHADSFATSLKALAESRSAGKENLSTVIAKLEKLFGIKSPAKGAEASEAQEETIDPSFGIHSVITAASGKKVITADNIAGVLDKLIAIREGAGFRKGDVFRLLETYIESGFVSQTNFGDVAQKLLDAAKVLNQNQLLFPESLLTTINGQDQKPVSLFDQTLKSWERLVDEVVLDAANRCITLQGEEKTNYAMAVYGLLANLVSLGLVDRENVYTVKEQLLELLTKDVFLPSIPEDLCKRAARMQFESITEMFMILNFMGLVANRCFTRELRVKILDTVAFLRTEGMLNDRTKDLLLKITKAADSRPVEQWRDWSALSGFWLNLYILCLRQAEFSAIEDGRELYLRVEQAVQRFKMSYEAQMSELFQGGKPGEHPEDYLVYLYWLVKEYESPEAARTITDSIAKKMGISAFDKTTVAILLEIDANLKTFSPAGPEIKAFDINVQSRSFAIPYNLKVILRDSIGKVLRNELGLAEEKRAEAVKALNAASALVTKLRAIPAEDADKFIEGLPELLGQDQVVADRQSIALMIEELVKTRQEEADAFFARQQALQTMEAARGAERKPAAEKYRQAKQRHEQIRQKARADFANARKTLNSILGKKVSNELVDTAAALVLEKIEPQSLSAYYDQTITGTDENALMARLANAEGADNLLDDAMADLGLDRAFKQHIIAHARWQMVLGRIVRDKERFLRNEQTRTKGINIKLVFKKMNLLTVFQGKYAGTCLQDDVSDMVADPSGNLRPGMFVVNILADGKLAGAVLFDVFERKLVLLGLDPSEFLVGTWAAPAQELLVDEIMPRIVAFAEKNNLEFLIPPSGAGGLSNRSETFKDRIREYMDTGTAVKLSARSYHPIYKYTVDSAHPYKARAAAGQQLGQSVAQADGGQDLSLIEENLLDAYQKIKSYIENNMLSAEDIINLLQFRISQGDDVDAAIIGVFSQFFQLPLKDLSGKRQQDICIISQNEDVFLFGVAIGKRDRDNTIIWNNEYNSALMNKNMAEYFNAQKAQELRARVNENVVLAMRQLNNERIRKDLASKLSKKIVKNCEREVQSSGIDGDAYPKGIVVELENFVKEDLGLPLPGMEFFRYYEKYLVAGRGQTSPINIFGVNVGYIDWEETGGEGRIKQHVHLIPENGDASEKINAMLQQIAQVISERSHRPGSTAGSRTDNPALGALDGGDSEDTIAVKLEDVHSFDPVQVQRITDALGSDKDRRLLEKLLGVDVEQTIGLRGREIGSVIGGAKPATYLSLFENSRELFLDEKTGMLLKKMGTEIVFLDEKQTAIIFSPDSVNRVLLQNREFLRTQLGIEINVPVDIQQWRDFMSSIRENSVLMGLCLGYPQSAVALQLPGIKTEESSILSMRIKERAPDIAELLKPFDIFFVSKNGVDDGIRTAVKMRIGYNNALRALDLATERIAPRFELSDDVIAPLTAEQVARLRSEIHKNIAEIGIEVIRDDSPERFARMLTEKFNCGFCNITDQRDIEHLKTLFKHVGQETSVEQIQEIVAELASAGTTFYAAPSLGIGIRGESRASGFLRDLFAAAGHDGFIFYRPSTMVGMQASVVHEMAELLAIKYGGEDKEFSTAYHHANPIALEMELDFVQTYYGLTAAENTVGTMSDEKKVAYAEPSAAAHMGALLMNAREFIRLQRDEQAKDGGISDLLKKSEEQLKKLREERNRINRMQMPLNPERASSRIDQLAILNGRIVDLEKDRQRLQIQYWQAAVDEYYKALRSALSLQLEAAQDQAVIAYTTFMRKMSDALGEDFTYIYPFMGPDIVPALFRKTYHININTEDFARGGKIIVKALNSHDAAAAPQTNILGIETARDVKNEADFYLRELASLPGKKVLILKDYSRNAMFGYERICDDVLAEGDAVVILKSEDEQFANTIIKHGFEERFRTRQGAYNFEKGEPQWAEEDFKVLLFPDTLRIFVKTAASGDRTRKDGGTSENLQIGSAEFPLGQGALMIKDPQGNELGRVFVTSAGAPKGAFVYFQSFVNIERVKSSPLFMRDVIKIGLTYSGINKRSPTTQEIKDLIGLGDIDNILPTHLDIVHVPKPYTETGVSADYLVDQLAPGRFAYLDLSQDPLYPTLIEQLVKRDRNRIWIEEKNWLASGPVLFDRLAAKLTNKTRRDVDAGNKDGGTGGIDLRALPISTQPVEAIGAAGGVNVPVAVDPKVIAALDQEWQSIEQQMRKGPMPYGKIKEYAASCKEKGARQQMDAMFSCIANMLRMEEDAAVATPPELKEILTTIG